MGSQRNGGGLRKDLQEKKTVDMPLGSKQKSPKKPTSALVLCGLALLVFCFVGVGSHIYRSGCQGKRLVAEETETLSSLLNTASPKTLHEVLNKHVPEYKPGVWRSERQAIEAVHRVDAPLATTLLRLAKREDNSTTTSPSSSNPPTSRPSSSTPPSISSTPTPSSRTRTSSPSSSVSTTPSSSSSSSGTVTIYTTRDPTTTSRSSKMVVQTFTSTARGGRTWTVTSTSYEYVDPTPTVTSEVTVAPPTLHNAAGRVDNGDVLMAVVVALAGALVV